MSLVSALRLVLGDQLSLSLASLRDASARDDIIVLAEVMEEARYVPHHKKKLAFLFSAMRHFAAELEARGFSVHYRRLDSEDGHESLTDVLAALVERFSPERVVLTAPGEYRVHQMMEDWRESFDCPVVIFADDRFLCSRDQFTDWAGTNPSTLRMEFFYREMRKRTGYLMDGDKPVGGRWNFDKENRRAMPLSVTPPQRPGFPPDAVTGEVIAMVAARFGDNFGDLEPFDYPVTAHDAARYLDWFIAQALPFFGTYQDAMRSGDPLLFHGHVSALINCGLIDPRAACEKAIAALDAGAAPLNAVEGFVRQIIGWREFIRGVYWLRMPGYGDLNALDAHRPLPDFFWTGETDMNCLAQAIGDTRRHAYAHHIQRLMVIGNFALLAGLDPKEVQRWFLLVYFDAYEWVEMPNVVGMALYADGGFFASKPYAASGAYIERMSDYCRTCRFDPRKRTGADACPFTTLYWDFLMRHNQRLAGNRRMSVILANIERFDDAERAAIKATARQRLERL